MIAQGIEVTPYFLHEYGTMYLNDSKLTGVIIVQRILIIEDDTDINHLIREALFRSGYTCVQAFSGTEGLLLAKEKGFQVIVLDLMLPGRSGKEILAELKAIEDTPVLILTSIDSLDSKLELLTAVRTTI